MSNFHPVMKAAEVPAKTAYCKQVGEISVVLCRVQDEIFAVVNECSHALATFDGGRLRGHRLICPLHGASFDVRSGAPLGAPAKDAIRALPTRITADGMLEVDIADASGESA